MNVLLGPGGAKFYQSKEVYPEQNVFLQYSDHSELTTTYTADDRSHLFGAVRQYSICVKISQSTLVPLKSVKSLRTYTRQHCMHCKGCHCRRNRCPCCLLKLNTKWAKGHDEGRVSRDYSRTSSLRQRPLCPSRTQQRHHLKKVFFPKCAGQDFGLYLKCVIYNFRKMTEIVQEFMF